MLKIDLDSTAFLSKWVRDKTKLTVLDIRDNYDTTDRTLLKRLANKKLVFVPVVPDLNTTKLLRKLKTVKNFLVDDGHVPKTYDTLDQVTKLFPITSVFEILIFIEGNDEISDRPTYDFKAKLMLKKVEQ